MRVPLSTGLAGHCARYGVPVVVADAYADSRFDRSVDASVGAAAGFKTQSVVCVPIRDPDGDVVGVLQAINRMASGSSPFDTDGDFAPPIATMDGSSAAATAGSGAASVGSAAAAALALTSSRSVDSAADTSTSGSLRGRTSTGAAGRSHNRLLALIDDGSDADHHHHDALSSSSATASPRVPPTPLPVPGTSGRGSFGFEGFGSAGASANSNSGGGGGARGGSGVFFGTYNKPPAPAPSAATLAMASAASTGSSAAGAGARPAGSSSDGDADSEPLPIWPFTASDVQLLEGMAAHTAVALRTAQLLEGLARGQRMTAALLDIVQSSATNKPMSALVEQIVGAAYTLLDCERVSLYLVDSVKQELWMAVAKDSDAVGTRIPIGHGLAGYVAATGQPLNIPDAYSDSRFDPTLDLASGFATKSVLVWPIAIADFMSGASSSGAGGSALQRTASRRRPGGGGAAGGATGAAVPSSSVIAVLQAINKRSSTLTRVATAASLLRAQGGLPSAAAAAAADAAAASAAHLKLSTAAREMRAIIPSAEGTSHRFAKPPTPVAAAGAVAVSEALVSAGAAASAANASGNGITRFDANDEKMMGAFCAEVSVALKRRSVEAAFMKVLSDSASAGGTVVTGVPEEFNVSLLALYTDAGTSARLHTSVQVRRMSVERSIAPLPTAPLALPSSPSAGIGGSGSSDSDIAAAASGDGSAAVADPAAAAAATLARKPAVRASFTARKALLAADADGVGVSAASADAAVGAPSSASAASALSTAVTTAASSGLPGDLDCSDPLLTWDWNVFALPLTGMPSLLLDPVMHAGDLTTLARGASLADGGLGADGAPMRLTHGCLTNHLQPNVVAAGEMRLAAAVPAMFRQFALLRRFGIDETKFAAFTRAVRRK